MKKFMFFHLSLFIASSSILAQNPRNVVLYNLTSTDCGPCSCMDSILNARIFPEFPNTVVLALHGIGSVFGRYQGDSARTYFNERFEPSGFIDGLGFDVPYFALRDSVFSRYSHQQGTPVKLEFLSKSWNPADRKVNIEFKATNTGERLMGPFWVNVVVTEGNIKQGHRTYTGCAKPDMPTPPYKLEYFNHNVVRKMEYWSKGDSLIGPSWQPGESVTRSVAVSLDTAWIPENCKVVVMVYRNNDSLYKAPVMQAVQQSVTGGLGLPDTEPAADGISLVYPNPSCGITNIHFSTKRGGPCTLQIIDQSGRIVETLVDHPVDPGIYNIGFNTHDYTPGICFCVLRTPAGMYTRPFLVK